MSLRMRVAVWAAVAFACLAMFWALSDLVRADPSPNRQVGGERGLDCLFLFTAD